MIEHIQAQAPVVSPKIGAIAEVVTSPTLVERASTIFESIRAIAENPTGVSLETLGLGIAAIASAAAAARAIQEIRKDRGDEETKKAAEKAARVWAEADGSLVAYSGLRSGGLERSLVSATSDVNRFMSRSDPRAQALDIALKLPTQERLASAMGFEEALDDFRRVMPRDAGIAQNHATLARLAGTPIEAAATGERAAFGALERGDAVTARGREACFTLLQSAAARAVAIERGEWTQEMSKAKEAQVEAPQPGPGRKGRAARGWDR